MAESQQMEQSLQVVMEHEVVQAQLSEMLDGDLMKSFRENMAPIRALMSRYRCAMMEVETKFKVLNEQFSLEHDRNRIESIKTRLNPWTAFWRSSTGGSCPSPCPPWRKISTMWQGCG